jgi:hypothetical protein
MRSLPLILAAALLCCACGVAVAAPGYSQQDMLRDMEALGARLQSGDAGRNPDAWREQAADTCDRSRWVPFVAGSNMPISLCHPTRENLDRLHRWGEPSSGPLPSPQEYNAWLLQVKRSLADSARLGAEPPDDHMRSAARARLAATLQQRAYADVRDPLPSYTERIAQMIEQYVLRPLFGQEGEPFRHGVIVVSLVLLGLVAGHIAFEIWRMVRHGTLAERRHRRTLSEARVVVLNSSEELLNQGDRACRSGRPLQAMGLYYLSLISYLARAGCTVLDRTLTNGEHYRMVQRSGRLSEEQMRRLAEVNSSFDEHCYGGRAPSESDVRAFRARIVEVKTGRVRPSEARTHESA